MAFSSSRLVIARQRRRFTRQGLAQTVGVPVKMLSVWELGEGEPSPPQLGLAAEALNFPTTFFLAGELDAVTSSRVSFRSLATMSMRLRDSVLASASIALALSKKIEDEFELPEPNLPDLLGESPEEAAELLRSHWGIGELSVRNVVHLLEQHGVRVFSLAADCREVDAFALWDDGLPFVFLNTLKSGERGRWDAAHELGHLVLHRGMEAQGARAEREADRFAAAFLMPESSVRSIRGTPSLDDLVRDKKLWGVSAIALARRQHAIGLMPDWFYKRIVVAMSQLGWRTCEPEGMPRETSQVFDKVFAAWREDGLSPTAIAEQLYLQPDELSGLVFGRMLHGVEGAGAEIRSRTHDDGRPMSKPSSLQLVR